MARPRPRKAPQGEKMIEVKVRFWTNDIAGGEGEIVPGHAWASGVIRMETNASHGIAPSRAVPFHSLMDLPAVMERVLIAHGVTLHISRRMGKYMTGEPPPLLPASTDRRRRLPLQRGLFGARAR
jgi:hypothetical protein